MRCYMLESAYANETRGRYTFLGFDPIMEIRCADGEMTAGILKLQTEHPSAYLRQILSEYKSPCFSYLPPFTGGLAGYFSYDYFGYSEASAKGQVEDTEKFPDVDLMLFDKVIAFDHFRQKIILIVNMKLHDVESEYNKAVMELKQLAHLLKNGEKKKETGGKRLEEITAAMQRLQTEKEEVQEQLKRKYQPQIKEQKNLISQIEYELEQLERQYQQDMLDLEEWKKKANEERNAKINRLENEQRKRVAELDGINSKLKNLNKEKTEKLDSLKQEWNKQQQALAAEKKTQAEVIGKEEKEEQRRISSIKTEYEADMQKELHSQGADTERLQDIANQLVQLEKELSFIKENATLVIEYQKDKRDLIDRIPGWQREHDEQKRLLQLERETLRVETSSLQEKIDLLNKEWEEAEENVRELQKNLEAYSKIPAYDWYKPHQDIFRSENTQTMQTTKTCMELIDELTRQANQFTQVQSKLRKEVNLFTGHFDEDNTFKFRVKFNEDWEYVRFADELHDFVEEHRIDEYIRRINNEHWDTFKRISMDTSMLTSSEDDIQDVIREINKGFATCNFVGVIQRIEMKVEESSNRVVNILREIQKYYHDYGYDLSPETNLFSSAKEQLVKEEAITLLRTFIKEIHAYRYDSIRLYDSFELRFRIVENGNDTGFIEKIANVGSEGTDILVKAMINIMLLNVFKEGASRKFKDFKLHCMMDEIGKLHPNNISGILKFANDRNIILINGSPTELNRDAYKHVYLLTKGTQNKTRIARLISDKQL